MGPVPNPIHRDACSPQVAWSTINAGEAIPGVVTPLTWSFFADATDRAIKQTFCDIGAMRRRQVRAELQPELRMWDVFYGRAAANLHMFRWIGDRMPGTSGDAIEEQIFGQVREGVRSERVLSRYPVVAAKMPLAALRLRGELARACAPVARFWQDALAPGALASPAVARRTLRQAHARFEAVMIPHTLAAMLCQALYEQLRRAAEAAGKPGLELRLLTGYGQMAETDVVSDLWQVSRDRLTLEEFLARHGYHGPDEGELSSPVWRLRPDPLHDLLEAYRRQPDERDPRVVERERARERVGAERELFGALPGPRRGPTRLIARIAARLIPLRGIGKAAFLQCVDVARQAALALGDELAGAALLERPQDAFMLTVDELCAETPAAGTAELAAGRRAHREEYRKLDIPDLFYGVPVPFALAAETAAEGPGEAIVGTPVSPGVVRGRARVMRDPFADEPLLGGEILVCRTTDPSWASAMMLASALVIDIGGPISHGAIVARELGIPCVIGTRNACQRIRTGDQLEVDGGRGRVEVLERDAGESPQATLIQEVTMSDRPDDDLPVLRALALKGRASISDLAAATGLEEPSVQAHLDALVAAEEARELRGAYALLPPARARLQSALERERAAVDPAALAALYDAFTEVNGDFKALAADWQLRDGEPNDHADATYDQAVLARLPGIDGRVQPLVERAGELVARLAVYGARLTAALDRVRAGDTDWLLKPLIDSYHTVWFELHEDLIALSGRSRVEEAAAGRAQ
jgi:phosphohistidine swiveling domain-containing protein/DNA-binding transcriptional ArsR family regulator